MSVDVGPLFRDANVGLTYLSKARVPTHVNVMSRPTSANVGPLPREKAKKRMRCTGSKARSDLQRLFTLTGVFKHMAMRDLVAQRIHLPVKN